MSLKRLAQLVLKFPCDTPTQEDELYRTVIELHDQFSVAVKRTCSGVPLLQDGGNDAASIKLSNMYQDESNDIRVRGAAMYWCAFTQYWGSDEKREEAVRLWKQAGTKLNHALSLGQVSVCYLRGKGVKQDERAAARYYRKAVQLGFPEKDDEFPLGKPNKQPSSLKPGEVKKWRRMKEDQEARRAARPWEQQRDVSVGGGGGATSPRDSLSSPRLGDSASPPLSPVAAVSSPRLSTRSPASPRTPRTPKGKKKKKSKHKPADGSKGPAKGSSTPESTKTAAADGATAEDNNEEPKSSPGTAVPRKKKGSRKKKKGSDKLASPAMRKRSFEKNALMNIKVGADCTPLSPGVRRKYSVEPAEAKFMRNLEIQATVMDAESRDDFLMSPRGEKLNVRVAKPRKQDAAEAEAKLMALLQK